MMPTPNRRILALATLAAALVANAQPTLEVPAQPATPPLLPTGDSRTGVVRYPIAPSAAEFVAPGYAEASNYARAEVEGVRRYFKLPGISAGVLIDGQVVWQEGFGLADVDAGRRVTPDTRFRVGSISKPITALAMATLVEAGRLDPDAPIQTYVPGFPEKDGVITARLLAGHLSGIRHYRRGESDAIRPRRYETMDDALRRFADDPLVYPAGTRYSYSTYGYTLLGAAVEAAAERPFLAYLDEAVLEPLEMASTGADRGDGLIPNLTSFYHRDRESNVVPAPPIDTSYKWAGGGLVSTTGDLLRFASEMMEPTLISTDMRDRMWTPMVTSTGQTTHYGMGWALDVDEFNRRVVAHAGGQVGCTAYLLIFPDLNAASVILCNTTSAEFGRDLAVVVAEAFIRQRDAMAAQATPHERATTPATAEP